ncbi:MAG: DNA-3-methyladenine glycosylase [Gemmatimonadota bacterium]
MAGVPDAERRDRPDRDAPLVQASLALPEAFFARPAAVVARELLGADLVSTVGGKRVVARIVESEAYIGPDDDASHANARLGRTLRNEAMFGPPGIAYVYRIYGIHWCLNVVTDTIGHPAAVLVRAATPIEGSAVAALRRGGRPEVELMRGPGNLCSALGVTGALNFHSFDRAPLQLVAGRAVPESGVERGPRIGITRAADQPFRFWVRGEPSVSRPR